jgi:hypothetical protein
VLNSRAVSWPYPQILDWTGKACQGQTLAHYESLQITSVESYVTFTMD